MAEAIISPGVFQRENDISFIRPQPQAIATAFIGPTVKGPAEIPTVVTSYNEYVGKFGLLLESSSNSYEFLTSIAVRNFFSQGGTTALVTRVVSGSYTTAQNTFISASAVTGSQPFQLETIGRGRIYNNATGLADPGTQNNDGSLVSGSADNLRWEVSNVNEEQGTFTLFVRQGNDNTRSKIILETFNNLSLDPNSTNYIERVIGNQTQTLVTGVDGTYLQTTGSYVNRSNYIRVSTVNLPTLNYLSTDGVTVNSGVNGSYSGSLPVIGSGSFYNATGTVTGGANFFQRINNTNTQGLVGGNYTNVINLLSNKEEYRFNVIVAPGLTYTNANHVPAIDSLISLVETRGDSIAVIDVQNYASTVSNVVAQAQLLNSSYTATYWPWLQVQSATGRTEWVPTSTVIPGVYAFTDAANAPWFAPAGLVRGGIPNVIQAERKLSRTQRDTLYSGKINPIATFPGQGIAVFGQKTLQSKASALDRVNVRRLLIELKAFIGDQARNLVFEQNTIATRNRFLATVNPYLDNIIQREGLFAYQVIMDDTVNTADVIDRNQLVGKIRLQPTRVAEFIILDFTVEPTGATFD